MAAKYYAVRKGRNTGIYRTWDECKSQVFQYSGAEYKSFTTEQELLNILAGLRIMMSRVRAMRMLMVLLI